MPPIDFDLWSQKSDAVRIYLVETSAMRLADGAILPLYFATRTVILENRCYLGTQIDLPRLSRQANSILSPNHVTTWGELGLGIEPDYRPDAYRSVTWLELLSPAWNLRDQPLIILEGGEGFAYSEFRPVFTGKVGIYNWNDSRLTLTIYDKTKSLDTTMPNYELPESRQVVEESFDQTVPALLGLVNNFKPILISTTNPGAYPWKYALACHVCQALDEVYGDNSPTSHSWIQKDVFPARKDAEGSAAMDSFGPYTGGLLKADWLVEIDSITALNSQGSSGPEVGLATFRWKLEGDTAWRGEGILTWLLAYDSTTLVKSPVVGAAVMEVTGDYTGDCKLDYQVKVVRAGNIGAAVPPRVIFSDDDGESWKPNEESSWTPIASAPGVMSVTAFNPYDVVQVVITTGGNVGAAVRFKWSNDGGVTWNTDNQIPDTSPIELFSGYSVQFSAPGEPGIDDYDAGDAGGSALAVDILSVDPPTTPASSQSIPLNRGLSAVFSGDGVSIPTPAFMVGDIWAFTFKEIPIPLADGASVQFITGAGDDFVLWDQWRFILGSSLLLPGVGEGVNITADARGLISPALGGLYGPDRRTDPGSVGALGQMGCGSGFRPTGPGRLQCHFSLSGGPICGFPHRDRRHY